MAEPPPQMAVNKKLPLMPLERASRPPNFTRRHVGRFEFLDQPAAARLLRASVEPPRHNRRPILHLPPRLHKNLAAIIRIALAPFPQDPAMQIRPQAQSVPAFSALESNARKPFSFRQFAHRDFKCLCCFVELQVRLSY